MSNTQFLMLCLIASFIVALFIIIVKYIKVILITMFLILAIVLLAELGDFRSDSDNNVQDIVQMMEANID